MRRQVIQGYSQSRVTSSTSTSRSAPPPLGANWYAITIVLPPDGLGREACHACTAPFVSRRSLELGGPRPGFPDRAREARTGTYVLYHSSAAIRQAQPRLGASGTLTAVTRSRLSVRDRLLPQGERLLAVDVRRTASETPSARLTL